MAPDAPDIAAAPRLRRHDLRTIVIGGTAHAQVAGCGDAVAAQAVIRTRIVAQSV